MWKPGKRYLRVEVSYSFTRGRGREDRKAIRDAVRDGKRERERRQSLLRDGTVVYSTLMRLLDAKDIETEGEALEGMYGCKVI